jgi:hypothetical protein
MRSAEFDIKEHFARFEAALAAFLKIWHMDAAIGLSAEDLAECVMDEFACVRNVVDKVKDERIAHLEGELTKLRGYLWRGETVRDEVGK